MGMIFSLSGLDWIWSQALGQGKKKNYSLKVLHTEFLKFNIHPLELYS